MRGGITGTRPWIAATCKGALQQIRDEARRAFDRLERDVTGEAVGNDYVGLATFYSVGFDEPVEPHMEMIRGAKFGSGDPQLVGALQFFRADIEQGNPRHLHADDAARISSAHDRELNEVLGFAFGIGAQIKHDHVIIAQGREQGRQCGPIDPRHGPQRQLGHRHQCARIAAGYSGIGSALFHAGDGDSHGSGFRAPDRLRRLILTRDDVRRVNDLARRCQRRMSGQLRADRGLIPNKLEAQRRIALERERRTRDHNRRAAVSSHRIDRDARS